MVTTTTVSITDADIQYVGPGYTDTNTDTSAAATGYLTQDISVSGAADTVFAGGYSLDTNPESTTYNSVIPEGSPDINDMIVVSGSNDLVSLYAYNSEIDAHTSTSNDVLDPGFHVSGVNNTVYGGAGNDSITSEGTYITEEGGETDTTSGASHTVGGSYEYVTGNFLYGEAGNDTILFTSADTVYGGQGDDTLTLHDSFYTPGYIGAFVSGDAGNDVIDISDSYYGNDTVYGGDGNDSITGSEDGYGQLYGQAGDDTILSTGGNDIVYGGQGNDHLIVTGYGDNFLSGDLGNDTIDLSGSGYGDNTVYGGAGDDTIYGSTGVNDQIYGQTGNDTIYLNGNDDVVYGGQGNDLIYDQGHDHSFISGDLGDDSIFASGAFDTIYGGDGNDSILGSGASQQLYGNAGNDIITYTFEDSAHSTAATTIFGGAGNDLITVTYDVTHATHTDTVVSTTDANGGATNATGSYTTTTVTEGDGYHFLSGDLGDDTISGGSGGDTFVGGAGSDLLISHRMEASGNDPDADGYQAGGPADHFDFFQNDSIGASPTAPGTGSDISTGGGEAGIDHITGFELNVVGVAYNAGTAPGSTAESYVNSQAGDDLYFLTGTHTSEATAAPDTNVFYGTVDNTVPATTVTEQSDYAVAYTYAFGAGGTAAAPTAGAHFAAAVDYIVVDVVDNGAGATNNGNIFVFDHNGNAVALDGAGLQSTGTTAGFQDSTSPTGGALNAPGEPVVSVNIYH